MPEETREGLDGNTEQETEVVENKDEESTQDNEVSLEDSDVEQPETEKAEVKTEPVQDWQKDYKELQGTYTQGQQKLREAEDQLKQLQGLIQNNPKVYDVVAKEYGLQQRPGSSKDEDELLKGIDEQSLRIIKRVARDEIQQNMAPSISQMNAQVTTLAEQQQLRQDEDEMRTLEGNGYTDVYDQERLALIDDLDQRHPGHTFTELYKLSLDLDKATESSRKLNEIQNNSKSRLVAKPGMSPRRVGVSNSDKGKSLEDLVNEERDA